MLKIEYQHLIQINQEQLYKILELQILTISQDVPLATDNYSKYRQQKVYALDYGNTNVNKETRVGLGNPGKVTRNRTSYTSSKMIGYC